MNSPNSHRSLRRKVELAVMRVLEKNMDNYRKIPQKECICKTCNAVRAIRAVFAKEAV